MIYTLTFNPAIDYKINLDFYTPGTINHSHDETLHIGGKGINVSVVLNSLNTPTTALGFIAGFSGNVIETTLAQMGIATDFISLPQGFSRINIKMKASEETEINGQGPNISERYVYDLYEKLSRLKSGDVLVLAGSAPPSLSPFIYRDILERLQYKNIMVIADTSGEHLTGILKYQPFLIKPNHSELNEIFGKHLEADSDIIESAKNLQERGAKNVLVSLGSRGAILVTQDDTVLIADAPKGNVINTTGSGDSMVAGFLAKYLETKNLDHSFKMGLAAGSANAFSINLPTSEEILSVYNNLLENPSE